ncbi:hypothetical protein JCM11491_006086 [Sporobolomyces phaffii]
MQTDLGELENSIGLRTLSTPALGPDERSPRSDRFLEGPTRAGATDNDESEASADSQAGRKVDRLSSLPNELLDSIFDYAHPVGYPSNGPLSKRLLPFYVVARYRRIRVTDSVTFADLVRKVNSDPQLGDLLFLSSNWDPRYHEILPHLPDRLELLSLTGCSYYISAASQSACDAALSRFTELRHLTLGNDLFSANLSTNLSTLVKLETLKVGRGWFKLRDLGDLIADSKLPSLRTLCLDYSDGNWGDCVDVWGPSPVVVNHLPRDGQVILDGWICPGFSDTHEYSVESAFDLILECRKNNIVINRAFGVLVDMFHEFFVEIANIAILRMVRDRDFRHYKTIRSNPSLNRHLPVLDLETLDPRNLQLVRLNDLEDGRYLLPGCHRLTVEERVEEETQEDRERLKTPGQVIRVDFKDGLGPR